MYHRYFDTAVQAGIRLNAAGKAAAFRGGFGLEKESLRIRKSDGYISETVHPFGDDPHFSRDFAESQLEIITPVVHSTEELYHMIAVMTDGAVRYLERAGETLHLSSNPPAYIPAQVRIAHFTGADEQKEQYRKYLLKKYGLERMLLSGIHFNYSYSEDYPALLGTTAEALYLKSAVYAFRYAWLIVWLTAASPEPAAAGELPVYGSVRCGKEGYWNSFLPVLDFSDVSAYCSSIERYVADGSLYAASELYLPVRLKPRGTNTLEALKKGIDHIELRMLDLNPLDPAGIAPEDLRFLQLFLIWCSLMPEYLPSKKEQADFIANIKNAALFDERRVWIRDSSVLTPVREAALTVLSEMACLFETIGHYEALSTIEYQKRKLLVPGGRYAQQVERKCANSLPSVRITA